MKPLSQTYKELRIAFTFPIKIEDDNGRTTYREYNADFWERRERDSKGNLTYYENSDGYWQKYERDDNGRPIYHEDSNGFWARWERDADGNMDYYENSDGKKEGTPRSANTCEGKVVEVDGIKYKLKAL